MTISPELRKLLQQALRIKNSQVPLHRVMDILATADGDISTVVHRFRDIRNDDLRRAFHFCADLLRHLESEAGMKPSWETYGTGPAPMQSAPGGGGGSSSTAPAAVPKSAPATPATPPKPKFKPADLVSFEDQSMVGQVPIAKAFVDGASKGNPGDAGIGVALFGMDGKKIAQISRAIGTATNNIAEYTALIEALHLATRMQVKRLFVLSDSQLMVYQMTGRYKIKNPDILLKVKEAMSLTKKFEKFNIDYIGREHNTMADALSTAQLKKKSAPPAGLPDFMPAMEEDPDEGATE